ncbi:MAG TPA: LamG-like jellyroll fold domain-containing protein, partial [Chitinophagaceae bacterium]|nr:LamG-like jellyroll fold domain-containing protein [Chitinophagaceae bacterium]
FNVVGGGTTIPLNIWTHIAGVWDGNELRVYVNGVLDGTTTDVTGAFDASSNPVMIGANLLSEAWTGKLDAVRIWSTARTEIEINATMNDCVTGTETGLLALYDFEEGSGTFVGDLTGNGYDGTLINSPDWTPGYTSGCSTLSVNFISISANRNSNGVLINWKVAAEQDMLRYEIERSADGRNFTKAGTVTATGSSSYNWLDVSALQQGSYYRVKSIDKRGIIKYTGIVKISSGNEPSMIRVWPNPVEGSEMNLQFKNQLSGRYEIRLLDAVGRMLFATTTDHAGGNSMETIELSPRIGRGFYQLVVIAPDKTIHLQKLLISKAK